MQQATVKMALHLSHLQMGDRISEPFPIQGTVPLCCEGGKVKGMPNPCPHAANA